MPRVLRFAAVSRTQPVVLGIAPQPRFGAPHFTVPADTSQSDASIVGSDVEPENISFDRLDIAGLPVFDEDPLSYEQV